MANSSTAHDITASIRRQGKNDGMECKVTTTEPQGFYCGPACRAGRAINNQACMNALKQQVKLESRIAGKNFKQGEATHAYDDLVCPPGKPIGYHAGNESPPCCVQIDAAGLIQGVTGQCTRLGNPWVQESIENGRKQRAAYAQTRAGKEEVQKLKKQAEIENRQAGEPKQTYLQYFMSHEDMWLAAIGVLLGGALLARGLN